MAVSTWFFPFSISAGGVVTNCTEANLRAAMAGGGTVTFACDGVINLAATITNAVDTMLDGSGHHVSISSASFDVRIFYVASNATLALDNLDIANGRATNGAGIFNDGGTLNLSRVVIQGNQAQGSSMVEGGAIFNRGGVVDATTCTFSNNTASQWLFQGPLDLKALGGAIRNESGVINLQDCTFMNNAAVGALPMYPYPGRDGFGGAIHNSGTLNAIRCSFVGNSARGNPATCCQPGPSGGSGVGGAIHNSGVLTLVASTMASNSASGGTGGVGSPGCATLCGDYPHPGGPGGRGGSAYGGALFNIGTASAANSTFAWNTCVAGAGGSGGAGGPGIYAGIPGTDGGNGGDGGSSSGGAVDGGVYFTNCSLAFNSAFPGAGGSGGPGGSALPPSISGRPGSNGTGGSASGGGVAGGLFAGTLLATNSPANSGGGVGDLGHNLSSDGSCAFNGPGSYNYTNPKLGPLANNAGPTLTMALLAGSPAIDAGDTAAAPPTDQRGFPRPAGAAADIGAFEYGSMMPRLSINRSEPTGLDITAYGNAGQFCRLLTSTNLYNWDPIATNQFSGAGRAVFHENDDSIKGWRCYRLVMP